MRHRRRTSTQTIRKKNNTSYTQTDLKSSRGFFGTLIKWLTVLVILGGGAYLVYYQVLPVLLSGPEEETSQVHQERTDTQQQPDLPMVDENDDQDQPAATLERNVQIEVLNGCGVDNVAKILSDKLKEKNYDVVNSGNFLKNGQPFWEVPRTRIIDQIKSEDNFREAEKLAGLVGIDPAGIESYARPSPIADITIIIGKDYTELAIFREN